MTVLVQRDSADLYVATRDGVFGLHTTSGDVQVIPWWLYGSAVRQILTDSKGVLIAAAVRDGGIVTTTDGGKTTTQASGVDGLDVRVLTAVGRTVYAGTATGALYRSEDGGSSFTRLDGFEGPWTTDWRPLGDTRTARVAAIAVRDKRLIVGVAAGSVIVSESGGENFRRIGDGLPNAVLSLALPHDSDELVYAGTLEGLYRTTKLGNSPWKHLWNPSGRRAVTALAIDPSQPQRLIAGVSRALYLAKPAIPEGADAWIYRSDDGGTTWQAQPRELLPVIRGIITAIEFVPRNPRQVFVTTSAGELFESTDSGESFVLASSTLPGALDLRLGAGSIG